ncbi:MAG: nucleoside hydrolase [Pseudomonadales bacterium]
MSIPVILDTDIGFDVDDVWALAFLLRCPEFDIKLITTTTGDTHYRACLVAKLLEIAGRTDIPIGIGIPLDHNAFTHSEWLGDYSLSDYSGTVITDGIGAICDTIMQSKAQVALIAIGPLPNLAAALYREPRITENARFVGMHGSLRRGYLGAPKPMKEFNVKQHTLSCRAVFEAPWEKLITPLDTCGIIALGGDRFRSLTESQDPLTQAVLANHYGWARAVSDWPLLKTLDMNQQSSILYDVVAVYLGFSTDLVEIETHNIVITNDGKTLIDPEGNPVQCATEWRDQEAFLDLVTSRLA